MYKEFLGAVYGWCFSKITGWGYYLLYYKTELMVCTLHARVYQRSPIPFPYTSGVRFGTRGQHRRCNLNWPRRD